MRILLEVEGHGLENFAVQHADTSREIAAFVGKVVKSRTRGPEPRVSVHVVSEEQVLVNVNELLSVKRRASAWDNRQGPRDEEAW